MTDQTTEVIEIEDEGLELTVRQLMSTAREKLALNTTLSNASQYLATLRGIKPYIDHRMDDPNSTYNLYVRDYLELMKKVKEPTKTKKRWGIF